MMDPIQHLPGIQATDQVTPRLRTRLLHCGPRNGDLVLFLHGNLASSTFWEETMLAISSRYRAVACDLRGYGMSDQAARIDATQGYRVWVEDAIALVDTLGYERFHVVGHSLGGCVVWGLLARAASRILSATLFAPGPPCGFGGAQGLPGKLNFEDGAGSGAGLVQPQLVERIATGEREISHPLLSPRAALNRLCWRPPFRPPREEQLLTGMLQIHLGDDAFPGDTRSSEHWPGFAPGRWGPINAISPRFNQWVLPGLLSSHAKPPLLWVHGKDDAIISDTSFSDAGQQGLLGFRPGWPGSDVFPPQPYLRQVEYAVQQYAQACGEVDELLMTDVGHTPFLERPAESQQTLLSHLSRSADENT